MITPNTENLVVPPVSFWLSVSVVINEVARSQSAIGLDWEVLIGQTIWSVHADYPDGTTHCLAYVEQSPHKARFSNTREYIKAWLLRQECLGQMIDGKLVTPYLGVAC
jgi:hypothetical protein